MITLTNVSKKYIVNKNEFCVLNNISLVLPDKGLVLLKGKSGSGKTTLLNIIAKIDTPTSGVVTSSSNYENAAIVFQDSQLIDDLSVEQNLKIIADIHGKNNEYIDDLLTRFELIQFKSKKNNQLSGGEKQRISIVRALLVDSPVLLCDEPTANLDLENAKYVVNILKEIAKTKLVMVATHDVELFETEMIGQIELSRGDLIQNTLKDVQNETLVTESSCIKRIPLKNLLLLSFKGLKKTISRYIFLIVSLSLSFLLIFFSLNILTLDSNQLRYKYNNKLEYINYVNTYDGNENNIESIYDYDKLNFEHIKVIYKKMEILIDNIYKVADMIYYVNECPYPMITGNAVISDNEIIIPSYYADIIINQSELTDYNQLIGRNERFFDSNVVISGIYDSTGIAENFLPAIVSENTVKPDKSWEAHQYYPLAFLVNGEINFELFYNMNEQSGSAYVGKNVENDDEIVIRYDDALALVGYVEEKIPDLIGTYTEEYRFIKETYFQKYNASNHNSGIIDYSNVSEPYKFKIVGVSSVCTEISGNLYNYLLENYATSSLLYGFAVKGDLSNEEFNSLRSMGYFDSTQYTEQIKTAFEKLTTISLVTTVVGVILAIIACCILFNYFSFSQVKKNKEIGILTSFGAKKKEMIEYILIDIFIAVLGSVLIANLLLPFANLWINNFVTKNKFTEINVLYYSWITIIISIAILLCFTCIAILFATLKNKKKTIYDLVYDRK